MEPLPVRWAEHDGTLALPERSEQVDLAQDEGCRGVTQGQPLERADGGPPFEERASQERIGLATVDRLDLDQAVIALVVFRRPRKADHEVATAQFETPDLRGADVNALARSFARAPQEAEAVGVHVEHPLHPFDAHPPRLRFQDEGDQLVLAAA